MIKLVKKDANTSYGLGESIFKPYSKEYIKHFQNSTVKSSTNGPIRNWAKVAKDILSKRTLNFVVQSY